jgi:hypothetical protein
MTSRFLDWLPPLATSGCEAGRCDWIKDPSGGAGVLTLHPTEWAPFFKSPVSSTTNIAPSSANASAT